ncbi:MAG TPA: phosphoglycerate kinase [Patescibacteria group bacterium]|nr:phosphoglycerate kinase [Patescibacteria group bacterium]
MNFKTLKDFDLKGKTVLLRADLNVPAKDGKVTDSTRIDRLKPTIAYLVEQGAKTLVFSHFGRPKGGPDPEFSLEFLTGPLQKSWGVAVPFAEDCIGPKAKKLRDSLKPGDIGLLENLRFHKGEEANDKAFVKELAALGDIYINDAFSAAHRAHASTEGLAHVLPAGAGLLMEAELNALHAALEKPVHPVAAIVGGAKISTKLELLGNLIEKTDVLILGGGMANTFLFAQGFNIKKSLCESEMADQARAIMEKAKKEKCEIILPVDGVAAAEFKADAPHETCGVNVVPDHHMILDIGPLTVQNLEKKLGSCKTVVWNGPMGAFELKPFDRGTVELAQFVAKKTKAGKLKSVAGGGDTVAALEEAGVVDDFTYVSTAGGAFLEWLEGKTLPGVAALESAESGQSRVARK